MEPQSDRQVHHYFMLSMGMIFALMLLILFGAGGIAEWTFGKFRPPVIAPQPISNYALKLEKDAGSIVEFSKEGPANIGVSNRKKESLLENEQRNVLEEGMPWYYFSPNVAIVSPKSVVNRFPLVKEEAVNGFSWRFFQEELLLFQQNRPYSGWYNARDFGWKYYKEGREEKSRSISKIETQGWIDINRFAKVLHLSTSSTPFFLQHKYQYQKQFEDIDLEYSILYKSPNRAIYSAPPGMLGSKIRTNTQNFVDMPMEVIEEIKTYTGDWLHVYIGYEELGWIKKDPLYQDYVLTYYSERTLLDEIQLTLEEYSSYIEATVGASFINNETMSQVSYNNQIFFPASTQKIYVLGELYYQYKTGELDPNQEVPLEADSIVPGAGVIQAYAPGSLFTIDELVDLVAIYSDNTAANTIIDTVGGGERITPHMHQLGLYDTYVNGKYYHSDTNGLFYTTPADAARYFALLYNDQVNGKPWDEKLIEKFMMNSHSFLKWRVPESTRAWNKSGLGETEQNDVATFVTPYGSYSLAVYTSYPMDYNIIEAQMGDLSAAVHETFNNQRMLLWETVEDPQAFMDTIRLNQMNKSLEAESQVSETENDSPIEDSQAVEVLEGNEEEPVREELIYE